MKSSGEFGMRFTTVMFEKMLTQKDVAKDTGIASMTLQKYRNLSKPPTNAKGTKFIKAFCQKYNINSIWLRTGEGQKDKIYEEEDMKFGVPRIQDPWTPNFYINVIKSAKKIIEFTDADLKVPPEEFDIFYAGCKKLGLDEIKELEVKHDESW